MRVGLAQINTKVGDLAGNKKKILSWAEKAKRSDIDLLVFPEACVTGYPPEDLLIKDHFVEDNIKVIKEIVKKVKGITVILGFVNKDKKGIYNSLVIIKDGKIKDIYSKRALPNYGVFDEQRYFKPGNKNVKFKLNGITFGTSICEDIWDQKILQDQIKDIDVLINISASPYHIKKTKEREKLLVKVAKINKISVLYCNTVGGQDELVFDGDSFMVNLNGRVVSKGNLFEEDLFSCDLSTRRDARPGVSTTSLVKIENKNLQKLSQHALFFKNFPPEYEIYQALVLGTKDYIHKNHFKTALIGLSGGIDSALVAAIAVDAIGKENVHCVSMPSRYSSKGTQNDAKKLAKNLGVKFYEIPIESLFKEYLQVLKPCFTGLKNDITEENIQARIRGNLLMSLSNKFKSLLLTTGNKSEVSVGYCTLYGDMSGGFNPLKDVYKTLVYKLANYINKEKGHELIPKDIITRPPSAELSKNQKDQDSLPPYDLLDEFLKQYIEKDKKVSHIKIKGLTIKIIERLARLVDLNEYKRRQAAPGIKITPKAFGRDRRFPITNGYED